MEKTEKQKSISSLNISVDEEINKETKRKPDYVYVSASVWVPLSFLAAVILAVANISVSTISHYRFKARYLQSFGGLVGNFFPIMLT